MRAFSAHVSELTKTYPNLHATFFTTSPSEEEKQGVHYHHAGRVDLSKLDANKDLFLNQADTEYYICGPDSFMTDMETNLKARGVDAARIKMELFGTGGVTR